jgi:hypothetical protein
MNTAPLTGCPEPSWIMTGQAITALNGSSSRWFGAAA